MNKTMKMLLGLLVLLMLGSAAVLLIIKPRITEKIRNVANEQLRAKVGFRDVDISLFGDFPRISFGVRDLLVTGNSGAFSGDTLAAIPKFSLTLDPWSVFSGKPEIQSIIVDSPKLHLKKAADGSVNWDIFPPSEKDIKDFSLDIDRLTIKGGEIRFDDVSNATTIQLQGFDQELTGRLSSKSSILNTKANVEKVAMTLGGMKYFNNIAADFTATLDADFEHRKFRLRKNRLKLNDFGLSFDGLVYMDGDSLNTDLRFQADRTTFKDLISLSPALYQKDFDKIDASGNISVNGYIKGILIRDLYPAFRIDAVVDQGAFGYRTLPARMNSIKGSMRIDNPGGNLDLTEISIPRLDLALNREAFVMRLHMAHPVTDPFFDAGLKGKLLLSDILKFYPVKNLSLSGELMSDVSVKGRLSSFKAGRYQETEARGSIFASNIRVSSASFKPDVFISQAQLNLSPSFLSVDNLRGTAGKTDFSINGTLKDYVLYALKKAALKGSVSMKSSHVQLDEIKTAGEQKLPLLPKPVDLSIAGNFDQIRFGKLQLQKASGKLVLNDETLLFQDISATALEGRVHVNGFYKTKGGKPESNIKLSVEQLDIIKSFHSVDLLKTISPAAGFSKGNISAKLNINSSLRQDFKPDLKTLSGSGNVNTTGLSVQAFPPMKALSLLLDVDELDTISVPKSSFDFVIGKELVTTKPFSVKLNDIKINAAGTTGFDQTLDWNLHLVIPKKYLGSAGLKTINGLVNKINTQGLGLSLSDTLFVDAKLKGTVTSPRISLDLDKTATKTAMLVQQKIQQKVMDELGKKLLSGKTDSSAGQKLPLKVDSLKSAKGLKQMIQDRLKPASAPSKTVTATQSGQQGTVSDTSAAARQKPQKSIFDLFRK
jgi:uncharacterized protein involved in outer membrane biogenesis